MDNPNTEEDRKITCGFQIPSVLSGNRNAMCLHFSTRVTDFTVLSFGAVQ